VENFQNFGATLIKRSPPLPFAGTFVIAAVEICISGCNFILKLWRAVFWFKLRARDIMAVHRIDDHGVRKRASR
jgi:hypothetical protein